MSDISKGDDAVRQAYKQLYGLFSDLVRDHGNSVVEAGVVQMLNDWNSKSDMQSSFASFAVGMIAAGAPKSVTEVFETVRNTLKSQSRAEK